MILLKAMNCILTKKFIDDNLLTVDGRLSPVNMKRFGIESTPMELYMVFHEMAEKGKCELCGDYTRFVSFRKGFRATCSSRCSKQVIINKNKSHSITKELIATEFILPNGKLSQGKMCLYDVSATECYNVYHGIDGAVCHHCGVRLHKIVTFKLGYPTYCSLQCSAKSADVKKKRTETNIKRYGDSNVWRSRTDSTTYDILENKNVLEKLYGEYESATKIASIIGVAHSTVSVYLRKHGIKITNSSSAERELVEFLQGHNLVRNDRTILDGKELDIYLPDNKLAIEYNGIVWHSFGKTFPNNAMIEDKSMHLRKTVECERQSIHLLHIFSNEWENPTKQEIWKSVINGKLGKNTTIYGRKTNAVKITSLVARNFCDDNHLQGGIGTSISYGLEYDDTIVAVMTFSKPRFNKKYDYELIRYCSMKGVHVVGGASKLLTKMKQYSIITYANRRWSRGDLYTKLGFNNMGNSLPNYFYIAKNQVRLESRNKYQKHKLVALLEDYDANLTESQNMFNNSYRRLWDCGNVVFTKEREQC